MIRRKILLFLLSGIIANPHSFAAGVTYEKPNLTSAEEAALAERRRESEEERRERLERVLAPVTAGQGKPAVAPPSVSKASTPDEALCGPKPTKEDRARENAKLNRINDLMPPVRQQNPAEWCSIFSAQAMVAYHNFKEHAAKGRAPHPDQFYDSTALASLFDIKAASTVISDGKDSLQLKTGGYTRNALIGLQRRNYQCRSEKSIGFTSELEDNPRVAGLVRRLVDKYDSKDAYKFGQGSISVNGNTYFCYTSDDQLSKLSAEVQEMLNNLEPSFETVNSDLFERAKRNNALTSPTEISKYYDVTRDIPNDYVSEPYNVEAIETSDPVAYLAQVANAFANGDGVPVEVGICAKDIPPYKADDGCGAHSVLLTGAAWKNGVCTVKLRNSWGADWPSDGDGTGTIEISASSVLETVKNFSRSGENKNGPVKFRASWLGPQVQGGQVPNLVTATESVSSDGSRFTGQLREGNFWNGTSTSPDGSIVTYANGRATFAKNLLSGSGRFTGSVQDTANGRWEYWNGEYREGDKVFTYKNGQMTQFQEAAKTVQNFALDDGSTFSGVRKDGRLFEGVQTLANNNGAIEYRNGEIVAYRNAIWNDKEQTRYTGSVARNANGSLRPITGAVLFPDKSSISYENESVTAYNNRPWGNGSRYTGSVVRQQNGSGYVPQTGTIAYNDGGFVHYQNGQPRYENYLWNDKEGMRFTGFARDNKPYTGTIVRGANQKSIYQDGRLVRVENWRDPAGERMFTGTVQETEGGFRFRDGILLENGQTYKLVGGQRQ